VERLPYIPVLAIYAFMTVCHLLPHLVSKRVAHSARFWSSIGALIHIVTLVWGVVHTTHAPGFPEALSATSVGIVVAYAWVGTGRVRAVGMLLAPLALVLLGTALVVPHSSVTAVEDLGYSPWLPIHLGLIFSGIGGFGLSGMVGIFYLWARDRLKKKQFDDLQSMPSLEVLDRIQFRAMLFGFVFLTLGIGAGGAWAAASLDESWSFDGKVLFTLLIWFWYGLALQVRLVLGRRGRWTALFSIVGFAGLMSSLVGVNFLISGWHGYGG
jgi:ABC-type transport system involved in cytochrome c biogenesis permease subunit